MLQYMVNINQVFKLIGEAKMKLWKVLVMSALLGILVLQAGCEPEPKKAEKLSIEPAEAEQVAEPVKKEAVSEQQAQEEEGNPSIKFNEVAHDFGDVEPDSYSTATFNFSNVGDGTLKITNTKGTCKCTVPKLKKNDYAPGESGQLTVKFHAPKSPGATSQHVFVFSNDGEYPKVELAIKAKVITHVEAVPTRLNFSLNKPNAGAEKIVIKTSDGKPFAITGFKSKDDIVTAEFDPTEMGTDFVLSPKVDVDKLLKSLNGGIEITLTHPQTKSVQVSFTTLPEFQTVPATIIIRNAIVGEQINRKLTLVSNYDEDIELESVSSKSGYVKMISKEKTANHFTIDLVITPPEPKSPKLRVFSDVIYINLKGGKQIDVNCRGFYPR